MDFRHKLVSEVKEEGMQITIIEGEYSVIRAGLLTLINKVAEGVGENTLDVLKEFIEVEKLKQGVEKDLKEEGIPKDFEDLIRRLSEED